VQTALMNLTLGEEERVSEKTIEQLIEAAHEEVLAKERAKHQEELKRYDSVKSTELANLADQKSALAEDLNLLMNERQNMLGKLTGIAHKFGKLVKWSCLVLCCILYLAALLFVLKVAPTVSASPAARIVSVIVFLASNVIAFNGGVSKRWAIAIGDWVSNKTLIWLSHRYLPPIRLKTQDTPHLT